MTTDLLMSQAAGAASYDLTIDSDGDFVSGDFFDSSLAYSIFGERRANASEVPLSEFRRGWIGNEGADFENGSKIWLFEQERLTRTVMNQIRTATLNALKWLVDDGILASVDVKVELTNDRSILLTIDLFRFNSKVDRRFFELWQNTGVL